MDVRGRGAALTAEGFAKAATLLGVTPATLWAVFEVESRGCGFQADRRPVILFERHKFYARTDGAHAAAHADLCHPEAGGYGPSASQHERFRRAAALDRAAAIWSTSWGLGQVMGFNWARAGFAAMDAMVAEMADGEDAQLAGMARFIAADAPMLAALRREDWAGFARRYNGPAYRRNDYDVRLRAAHARHKVGPLPDLHAREAQLLLTYLGHGPLRIDGWPGPVTFRELNAFRDAAGLPRATRITRRDLAALRAKGCAD